MRADQLQAEAQLVLAALDLRALLATYGDPRLVGSLAMGLMTHRDIDFNVLVPQVGPAVLETVYDVMRPLVVHPRVFRLRFASQLGPFNPDGSRTEEGFYCGVHVRADHGADWKIDIWTVEPPRPEIALVDRVNQVLNPEMRSLILTIKQRLKSGEIDAGFSVQSRHVYQAVLAGVRDVAEFQIWLDQYRERPEQPAHGDAFG